MDERVTVQRLIDALTRAVNDCPYGSNEMPVIFEWEEPETHETITLEFDAVHLEDSSIFVFLERHE